MTVNRKQKWKENVLHQMLFLDEILCIRKLLNKTKTRLIEIAKLEVNSIFSESYLKNKISNCQLIRSIWRAVTITLTLILHRTIANRIPKLFIAKQNKHWKTIIKERTRTLTKDTQNNVIIIDSETTHSLNETRTFFQQTEKETFKEKKVNVVLFNIPLIKANQ